MSIRLSVAVMSESKCHRDGTGSFVTALRGRSLLPGRDDRQILSPSWVTLGHELGHAANIKAGAALVSEKTFEGSLTDRLTIAPERDHRRWDNAEEMVNIENVERHAARVPPIRA